MVSGRRFSGAALLLAVALLFCHGIFGASHVLQEEDGLLKGGGTPTATHDAVLGHEAEGPVSDAGHASGHVPGHHAGAAKEYFAVLLVFAGAATLWLFLRVFWRALTRRESVWLLWARRCNAGAPLLPEGPSPPLLQVFRL